MILQLAISSCLHILQYDSYHLLYPHITMFKTGTSGEISRIFKPHFHPLKDYETWYVLAPTIINIEPLCVLLLFNHKTSPNLELVSTVQAAC